MSKHGDWSNTILSFEQQNGVFGDFIKKHVIWPTKNKVEFNNTHGFNSKKQRLISNEHRCLDKQQTVGSYQLQIRHGVHQEGWLNHLKLFLSASNTLLFGGFNPSEKY